MRIDPVDYCRTKAAAAYAGVTPAFVMRLADAGAIRSFAVCGVRFFLRSDAIAYKPRDGSRKHRPRTARPEPGTKILPADYVTTSTAAGIAGVARQHMSREARTGRIPAVWIDGQWLVLRSAAEAYERHPSAGRPRIHPLPRIHPAANHAPAANQAPAKPTRRRRRKASA